MAPSEYRAGAPCARAARLPIRGSNEGNGTIGARANPQELNGPAGEGEVAIRFEGAARFYGAVCALAPTDLDIARRQFVALVGASGAGKSTLLKLVNRLETPSEGRVLVEGRDVATLDAPIHRRSIGYVFQSIGLFAHMNVAANIAISPRLMGAPLSSERIARLLELVELDPALAARMPDELSGGQRQRVGVARALAAEPKIVLMDEPFGALDPITRDALAKRVRRLHEDLGLTSVMVTHDMAEALLIADRVVVMDAGRIVADETPRALLAGAGGAIAQSLVAVPREQASQLARMAQQGEEGSAR